MAAVLGLGCTHYPGLLLPDDRMTGSFHSFLHAPNVPEFYKDPANWPAELKTELGDDRGATAAVRYAERMKQNFLRLRGQLDDFQPDLVLVVGDDQYENFREDIIPPFCVFGLDDPFTEQPWKGDRKNRWNEAADWTLTLHGHRDAAKILTTGLIERGFDIPYAYKPLHIDHLAHAFTNTLLYLDWDRRGFPYPVVPFAINCYGRNLLQAQGGTAALFRPKPGENQVPDPPAPAPWRCMDVGRAMAEIFAELPWRVAMIASSSWSHCFLSPTNGYLWPDHAADRILLEALRDNDYTTWRQRPLRAMEAAGQHEMLNWMVVAGAMDALGQRADVHDYIETHIFLSNKAFVSWRPTHS